MTPTVLVLAGLAAVLDLSALAELQVSVLIAATTFVGHFRFRFGQLPLAILLLLFKD